MCKIFLIANPAQKDTAKLTKLVAANEELLAQEPDGYAVYRDGRVFEFTGGQAYKHFTKNIEYRNERLFIVHTRTATAGNRQKKGLHLKAIRGYRFAHNGYVSSYASVKRYSDSYFFFKNYLVKQNYQPDKATLLKEVEKKGFSGRGVLLGADRLLIFGNSVAHLTFLPDSLIFTSFEPDLYELRRGIYEVLGFPIIKIEKGKEIKVLYQEKIDNFYLEFRNLNLVDRDKCPSVYGGGSFYVFRSKTGGYKTDNTPAYKGWSGADYSPD